MSVTIKTPDEIEKMRIAGRLGSEVLDYITPFVKAGVSTAEIDKLCHDYMVDVQGCIPAPLNYAPSSRKLTNRKFRHPALARRHFDNSAGTATC